MKNEVVPNIYSPFTGSGPSGPEEARAFLYYGPGRSLARFTPAQLTSMSFPGLNLLMLLDRSENDGSYR